MTRRTILAALLLVALTIGAAAPAALANTSGVASFQGEAAVGHWFRDTAPCDKDGEGEPEGEGLYFPLIGPPRDRSGVWKLDTAFTFVGRAHGALSPAPIPGSLRVCGQLDREAAGLGAGCGASKGFAGRGRVVDENGLLDLKLYNVGWKEALGGVLPVTGNYQEYDGSGGKTSKVGTFVALVRVAPGTLAEAVPGVEACLGSGNGAKTFAAAGIAVFAEAFHDAGKAPDGKQCREDGPADKSATPPAITDCPEPGTGK